MRFSFSLAVRAWLVGMASATLLGACSTTPVRQPIPVDRAAAQAPSVEAENDLLAKLIAAQFALQNDELAAAARGFVDAAAQSDDPAVAEEATQLALSQ